LTPLILGSVIYFIYFKLIYIFSTSSGGREALVYDYESKSRWFLFDVLPRVLSFWDLNYNLIYINICFSFTILMILLYFINIKKQVILIDVIKILISFVIIIISFLPNIIARESIIYHRLFIVIQPLLCICIFLILKKLFNEFAYTLKIFNYIVLNQTKDFFYSIFCIVILTIGITTAHYNVNWLIVIPNSIELNFVSERIKNSKYNESINIHLVRPDKLITTTFDGDTFGRITTLYPQDTGPLLLGALRNNGIFNYELKFTTGKTTGLYDFPGLDFPVFRELPVPENSLIININELYLNVDSSSKRNALE
jgi:hypothetical protein